MRLVIAGNHDTLLDEKYVQTHGEESGSHEQAVKIMNETLALHTRDKAGTRLHLRMVLHLIFTLRPLRRPNTHPSTLSMPFSMR